MKWPNVENFKNHYSMSAFEESKDFFADVFLNNSAVTVH